MSEIPIQTPPTAGAPSPGAATPEPVTTQTPTVTHYEQLAANFLRALDEIVQIIPPLETVHPATAEFVRTHLNVSRDFLATATAAVEQSPELQGLNKLDVSTARDTLQFIDAFQPVFDKMSAVAQKLKFSMSTRRANLVADCLQIYAVVKAVARDPNSGDAHIHVRNLKRTLGRRGRRLKDSGGSQPAPKPGANTPPQEGQGA